MVLTDRQRSDLHAGIYEYLCSLEGEAFAKAAQSLQEADPENCKTEGEGGKSTSRTKLEQKWTAIPRLQKKVLELERQIGQSQKIHAHRMVETAVAGGGPRRMLPREPPTHTLAGHSAVVTAVQVHPVYTVVVSGSEDGTIKVWDHESGDYIRTLKGHTNTVHYVAFTPTGSHLASCSTDLSIKLWDFKDSYVCLRTLRGHDHTISCVKFLPVLGLTIAPSETTTGMDAATAGCQHLISASRDQTVKLWDIETGFCDHTINDHTDWARCLAVRESDGTLWASGGNDCVIYVYDNTRAKVAELRGHEQVIESISFLKEPPLKAPPQRDSKHTQLVRDYIASGSRDRTVRLWKISEASCIAVFKAHENWVRSVVIHPSGNYIISSSDDKSIRIFDVKNNRCLRTITDAHKHFVSSIDMHYQLPILVSGSVDTTLRCWMLD